MTDYIGDDDDQMVFILNVVVKVTSNLLTRLIEVGEAVAIDRRWASREQTALDFSGSVESVFQSPIAVQQPAMLSQQPFQGLGAIRTSGGERFAP
jgi:hypothetical protein